MQRQHLSSLIEKYKLLAYRVAYRYLRRHRYADKDDILQMALIATWKCLSSLDATRTQQEQVCFVAQSVHNMLYSYGKTAHCIDAEEFNIHLGGTSEDEDAIIIDKLTVWEAARDLTGKRRQIFLLLMQNDMDIEDTAKRMGVSHQRISQQLAKIKQHIREKLT